MLRLLRLGVLVALTAIPSSAQEWSAAQKAVWDSVKAYTEAADRGDVEGYLSYLHEEYRGWPNAWPLPSRKADVRKVLGHFLKVETTELSWIEPVSIQIFDDVAIVNYYFGLHLKDEEGKIRNTGGRWTDILLKQGDKWLLVADHGGANPSGN
jgi:ketosteroid isomerase-like protein